MTNEQVRDWYKLQVGQISQLNEAWVVEGLSAENRARRAWQIRHDARLKAREMMVDPIEVELLRNRDIKEYSTPDGTHL